MARDTNECSGRWTLDRPRGNHVLRFFPVFSPREFRLSAMLPSAAEALALTTVTELLALFRVPRELWVAGRRPPALVACSCEQASTAVEALKVVEATQAGLVYRLARRITRGAIGKTPTLGNNQVRHLPTRHGGLLCRVPHQRASRESSK